METLFNKYITKQEGKDIEEIVKLQRRKGPYISSDNLGDKYLQSLLINESLISLRLQKQIKLTTKLNRYYNIGLEFIKIWGKDNSEVNNIVPDPLNQWLIVSRILYLTLAKVALDLLSILVISSIYKRAFS